MRKRNVQIMFRLNEQEADQLNDLVRHQLNDLVRRSGLKRERFLRSMILGYRLCEKPDPAFYDIQKELCAIGNRVNQLAVKANALGFIDTPMLEEEVRQWRKFRLDVSKRFLKPRAR